MLTLNPEIRVTVLTREEWTKGPATVPAASGIQMGPGCIGEPGPDTMGNFGGKGSVSL
jgi:hypothetical protein